MTYCPAEGRKILSRCSRDEQSPQSRDVAVAQSVLPQKKAVLVFTAYTTHFVWLSGILAPVGDAGKLADTMERMFAERLLRECLWIVTTIYYGIITHAELTQPRLTFSKHVSF